MTKIIILSTFLLLTPDFVSARFPSCDSIFTDHDGDGYGYENFQTCIVDDSSRTTPAAGICDDPDGDGYGWDGMQSCIVEQPSTPDCVDTDPNGDGWGWDGTGSCRVAPEIEEPTSELEVLRTKLIDRSYNDSPGHTTAGVYCPARNLRLYLRDDGYIQPTAEPTFSAGGSWTTGIDGTDGLISLWRPYRGVLVLETSLQIGSDDVTDVVSGERCTWIK